MKMPFLVEKYIKQFKAMNPKYDVVYDVKTDAPIIFEDSANVRFSMAIIAMVFFFFFLFGAGNLDWWPAAFLISETILGVIIIFLGIGL